ncbi:helix-turn-helix domain-containing protein [Kitasatospora sp. NPDC050463]|uniref:PucR family transcriptional regulator n=1 Tax=Kitasatospora sp. NPDC050463 TaxID=3155786 RepID=UPI0034106353
MVGVGPAVAAEAGWERYGETLREARTTLELAVTVPPAEPDAAARPGEPHVTSARSLALERELTRSGGPERWARLADDSLGPLLAWEARHPSDLVRTLEVHLRNGCSPTRTAALLHIGRQSFYQRLERIELLLGSEVDDPELHGEWLLATCAHRLLRSGERIGARPAGHPVDHPVDRSVDRSVDRLGADQREGARAGTRRSPAYSTAVSAKPTRQVRSPIEGAALTR